MAPMNTASAAAAAAAAETNDTKSWTAAIHKNSKRRIVSLSFIVFSIIYVFLTHEHTKTTTKTTEITSRRLQSSDTSATTTTTSSSSSSSSSSNEPKIPKIIIFTYKYDIFKRKQPPAIHSNMQKTISTFRDAWDLPSAPVKLYTDDDCIKMLRVVMPDLVPHFRNEKYGWNKADLCRIVVLYLHGGYYFDSDMEVITPVRIEDDVSFATVIQPRRKDFFQSFMASEPNNPILYRALKNMLAVYNKQREVNLLLGTETLKWAYDSVPYTKRGKVFLLEEIFLEPHRYPELPRQKGYGCCCNFIVHDPQMEVAHFYSRMVGPLERCSETPVNW